MRDRQTLFSALERSAFRRRFHLGEKEQAYLAEKGAACVSEHARAFIIERLASAQPRRDGKQTPYRGHPVFVAQHATATCCRGCLQKWHGIEKGRALTEDEIAYVVGFITGWLAGESAG